jgi:hypothetical protein
VEEEGKKWVRKRRGNKGKMWDGERKRERDWKGKSYGRWKERGKGWERKGRGRKKVWKVERKVYQYMGKEMREEKSGYGETIRKIERQKAVMVKGEEGQGERTECECRKGIREEGR